jgi:hypothetical protein
MRLRKALPLGINHLVGNFLIGMGGIDGTLCLGHQCVEFTALVVGKYLLPLIGRVSLGLLQHLEQSVGLVHTLIGL